MRYLVFVAYYIYLLVIIFATGYIVFWKGYSGWWFLLTAIFSNVSPLFKSGDKKDG